MSLVVVAFRKCDLRVVVADWCCFDRRVCLVASLPYESGTCNVPLRFISRFLASSTPIIPAPSAGHAAGVMLKLGAAVGAGIAVV
jgi:hypothetical protein